jgi:hypothetical protein
MIIKSSANDITDSFSLSAVGKHRYLFEVLCSPRDQIKEQRSDAEQACRIVPILQKDKGTPFSVTEVYVMTISYDECFASFGGYELK